MGGLGTDVNALGLNRINSPRQPGSSIKPIASISPGLENQIITASTVYDDSPTYFGSWTTRNASGYLGLITVRKAIEVSSNVVEVKIMSELGPENSIKFLKQLGLKHLDDEEDNGLALVLGGITNGATPLEMAGAYAAIANNGEYITPTFYSKLVDRDGKTVMEPKQEKRRVMSEGTAYMVKSILKSPVTGPDGTARICQISGMDVGAKTGTTDNDYDRWLCGITPYYAAATWFGFDKNEYINYSGNPSAKIWSAIMDDIHEDLPSKTFDKPSNIVTARICKDSGKSATGSCTNTYVEEFVSGTVPDACDGHSKLKICKESGKLATKYCTDTEEVTKLKAPEKERNVTAWKTNAGKKYSTITENCSIHTEENKDKDKDKGKDKDNKNENNQNDKDNNNNNNNNTGNNSNNGNNENDNKNDTNEDKKVSVPVVVDKDLETAKSALESVKLKYKIVYDEDDSKENGIVLKQSRKATEEVKEGTIVTITVNKKKEKTDTNTNTKNTVEEN